MTPEKRIWIASLISAGLMLLYMQMMPQRIPPTSGAAQQAPSQSQPIVKQDVVKSTAEMILLKNPTEETVILDSAKLRFEFGARTASLKRVIAKEFSQLSTGERVEFGDHAPVLVPVVGDPPVEWTLETSAGSSASWSASVDDVELALSIAMNPDSPTATMTLELINQDNRQAMVPVSMFAEWSRSDGMAGNSNLLEVTLKTTPSGWQREYLRYGIVNAPRTVPRGTSVVTLSERYFCESIKLWGSLEPTLLPPTSKDRTVAIKASEVISVPASQRISKTAEVYVGPRDFFYLEKAGFEEAFHLGFLSRIGLILMLFLKGMAGLTHNYGVAIILLSILVTLAVAPFTLMSLRSMKKMQALQPRMDQLRKKHEKDQQRLNQEMFGLFKEHKVSPLSGCLPMLLPLPIFFAIWSAMSHVIELRGQRFLWIKDLSLPDHLAALPLGFHLNLLPIIMAAAMYLQTKLSQQQMPSGNPSTKFMSGPLMPILFGFMFYQLPSGLVLYWLTNSVGSILLYRSVKS